MEHLVCGVAALGPANAASKQQQARGPVDAILERHGNLRVHLIKRGYPREGTRERSDRALVRRPWRLSLKQLDGGAAIHAVDKFVEKDAVPLRRSRLVGIPTRTAGKTRASASANCNDEDEAE